MRILILLFLFLLPQLTFSMGSKEPPKQVKQPKREVKKKEKVLLHVIMPKGNFINDGLRKEVYQIILDEVINKEEFSLVLNKPNRVRNAKIKFVEIHTEISGTDPNLESDQNLYNAGLYFADGNTGVVFMQDEKNRIPENRLRYYIRKTLRGFLYKKSSKQKKKRDPTEQSDLIKSNEESVAGSTDRFRDEKSSSEFNALFEKRNKKLSSRGGEAKIDLEKIRTKKREEIIPYRFQKKKSSEAGERESRAGAFGGGVSQPIKSAGDKSDLYKKKEESSNNEKSDGDYGGAAPEEQLGQAEKMSKDLNKKLEEYAQDEEVIKELNEINKKRSSSDDAGQAGVMSEDGQFSGKAAKDFNKIDVIKGESIYSLGVNFRVDKVESLDLISTTNNFKQIGISGRLNKYMKGRRGERISGDFLYSTVIDYDKSFELPSSFRLSADYHKDFSDFFLGVVGLEYESQFFVNVARSGTSLQAWNNKILWYSLGLDLEFEVLFSYLNISALFSKPFVGNTDYGGEEGRTIDGNRVNVKLELGLYKNLSLKGEVLWTEITSQGLTSLKNTHLTSATYLIYSFF